MDRVKYQKFKATMAIRKLDFKWERINTVRPHGTKETLKHWLMKCICLRIVNIAGHVGFGEFKLPNDCEIDVYDATDNVAIEIESRKSKKAVDWKLLKYKAYVRDVFILYCEDFSDNPEEMEKELRHKLGL